MSRMSHNLILLLAAVLGLGGSAFATPAPIGSVTITCGEQSSGGVWDSGTVTATLNGVSISIPYGQYSSPAGIASGLASMISQNCNMPVYAQATGATINFYTKGSNVLSSATITGTSSNPTLFSGSSFQVNGASSVSAPQIGGLSLPTGPPSMGLTITGSNFGSTQGTVTVGGMTATVLSWTASSITVQVPTGASAGGVQVTANGGLPSSPFPFSVSTPFGCN